MNADPRPTEDDVARTSVRRSGSVLSFASAPARRSRRSADPTSPRGEILLFTGVRYERERADDVALDEAAVSGRGPL